MDCFEKFCTRNLERPRPAKTNIAPKKFNPKIPKVLFTQKNIGKRKACCLRPELSEATHCQMWIKKARLFFCPQAYMFCCKELRLPQCFAHELEFRAGALFRSFRLVQRSRDPLSNRSDSTNFTLKAAIVRRMSWNTKSHFMNFLVQKFIIKSHSKFTRQGFLATHGIQCMKIMDSGRLGPSKSRFKNFMSYCFFYAFRPKREWKQ